MPHQLGLFGDIGKPGEPQRKQPERLSIRQPEPTTVVRLGTKAAQIPLRQKRREALAKLFGVLKQLEGHDVFVSTSGGSHSHFWLNTLKLGRLKVETFQGGDNLPAVLVLWGSRGASVRIFTDQMVDVREQDYQGYTLWLVDFWNSFGEYPLDPYKPKGFVSLEIARFKD